MTDFNSFDFEHILQSHERGGFPFDDFTHLPVFGFYLISTK